MSSVPRSETPRWRRPGWLAATGALLSAVLSCALVAPATAAVEPWMNTSLTPDRRADLLAAQMNLDQKVRLFNPNNSVTVPELGIPARNEIDSTLGVHRGSQSTTAFPSAFALAASADKSLARAWGNHTAKEDFALGYSGDAAPTLDVTRSPYWGRQWEGLGEDPVLSGSLGGAEIKGIQSQEGVYALVKHFGVYTQETGRASLDNRVSGRTERELYLRGWDIATKTAKPGAVMCAFPKINGTYACQDSELLDGILKGEWGYRGYVSSDFNACNEDFVAFTAGADRCGDAWPTYDQLKGAVQDGTIPAARFDDMVHRVLRTMFAEGLFDHRAPGTTGDAIVAQPALPTALTDAGEDLAERAATEGSVLLKNERGTLPLRRNSSVAVIGAGADEYVTGTGSPQVPLPAKVTTVVDGIRSRVGASNVTYTPGTDDIRLGDVLPGPAAVPSSVLKPSSGSGSGLTGQYFLNTTFSGDPLATRTDDQVNLRTGLAALIENFDSHVRREPGQVPFPVLTTASSMRWTGTMNPVVTGTYRLALTHFGSASLYVNGERVLTGAGRTLGTETVGIPMRAGQSYDIRIEYVTDAPNQTPAAGSKEGPTVRFGWVPPTDTASPQIQQAVAAAKKAKVAVVVVRDEVGEATDRYTLSLPQDQDRLVRAVAKVNPRTIVVSATSGPVLMPWNTQVEGIVQSWYPGEAGGKAIAKLLYGDANFSGKLPVTFPASEKQVRTVVPDADPTTDFGKEVTTLTYAEGVYSGYRGYQRKNQKPLYAFGAGLSYTDFSYRTLTVSGGDERPAVRLAVRNTGGRRSAAIVQVYVGTLPGKAATPRRQLAGYARVNLGARKTKQVTVRLEPRVFQVWSESRSRWVTPSGRVRVYVGSSSTDLPLKGTMLVG